MEVRERVIQQIEEQKIIAIIRGMEPENIIKVAQALYEGGIRMIEVTFDQSDLKKQEATVESIRIISEFFKDKVFVGAGTVTTVDLVEKAAKAGAMYIISPDASEAFICKTRELGLVSIPGALTPTEILNAHRWGADFVKLFPVGTLGTGYIKALKAPINHIKLLAVGGVNPDNAVSFLDAGCEGIGIGGNLVNKEWIKAREYEKITEQAKALTEQVNAWRNR